MKELSLLIIACISTVFPLQGKESTAQNTSAVSPPAAHSKLSPRQAFRILDKLNFFYLEDDSKEFKETATRFRLNMQQREQNPDKANAYPWVTELLHLAYIQGNSYLIRPDILQCFIDITTDINAKDDYGQTAMDYAVHCSVAQFFHPLLAAGAGVDVTKCQESGLTALACAVEEGDKRATEYLLQQGSYVNHFDDEGTAVIDIALEQGHQEIVDLLLAAGASMNPDWENDSGYTHLHHAAGGGCTEQVRELLRNGADVSLQTTDEESSALMLASMRGHKEIVLELLKHGAKLRQKDAYEKTVLENAVATDSPCFTLLFQEAKKQKWVTKDLLSELLDEAINAGNCDLACFLLQSGAEFDAEQNGWHYLSTALRNQHEPLLLLLEKAGAQYDALTPDDDGVTHLMLAAEYGSPELVEQFLEDEANVHAMDNDEVNVMTYALRGGSEEVISLLREAGAEFSPRATTPEGETQLMLAARHGLLPIVRELLKQRASVHTRTAIGKTALMEALEQGHEPVIRLLLKSGEKLSAPTAPGKWTQLMSAALGGQEAYVRKLLQMGSDPNAVLYPDDSPDTPCGTTALMLAAQQGHKNIVHLLIQAGAFPQLRNSEGNTAADLARENGHANIADYLNALP